MSENIIQGIISIGVIFISYLMLTTTEEKSIKAISIFEGSIKGVVRFTENLKNDTVEIDINLSGLNKNAEHGFHVHESGDLSNKCESLCAHFNPYNTKHGDINSDERHVGDLGNLKTDNDGNVKYKIIDKMIKLRGICNIIGRGLIIHADKDDGGKGNNEASLINGNSGKRIACAIIGYSQDNFVNNS
jgi:Cu-Zn family superoxide dismutase